MSNTVKYCLQVKNVKQEIEFNVDFETEGAMKSAYQKYKKDKDYEVVSAYSVLLEVRPIALMDMEEPIL